MAIEEIKKGLESAVAEALGKPTEKERLIAIVDVVRGYKNTYDMKVQPEMYDAYKMAKIDFERQRNKVKDLIVKLHTENK